VKPCLVAFKAYVPRIFTTEYTEYKERTRSLLGWARRSKRAPRISVLSLIPHTSTPIPRTTILNPKKTSLISRAADTTVPLHSRNKTPCPSGARRARPLRVLRVKFFLPFINKPQTTTPHAPKERLNPPRRGERSGWRGGLNIIDSGGL
jgi:hypothetical protein